MFQTPREAVEALRNSSIYLALLHLLKQLCDGEFGVARSLVGGALPAATQIRGVRITAEVALIGAAASAAHGRRSTRMRSATACGRECVGLPARGATVRDGERAAGRFRGARLLGDVPLFWPHLPPQGQRGRVHQGPTMGPGPRCPGGDKSFVSCDCSPACPSLAGNRGKKRRAGEVRRHLALLVAANLGMRVPQLLDYDSGPSKRGLEKEGAGGAIRQGRGRTRIMAAAQSSRRAGPLSERQFDPRHTVEGHFSERA